MKGARTSLFHNIYMQYQQVNNEMIDLVNTTGFIQASMGKIQGLFKDFSKHLQQFSRT